MKKSTPQQASPSLSPEVQAALDAVRKAEEALRQAQAAYEQAQQTPSAESDHACRSDAERLYDQGLAFVRQYPGVGVCGAAVLGFLVGRALRR